MATASTTARGRDNTAPATIADGLREAGASAKQAVTDGIASIRTSAAEYVEHGKDAARDFGQRIEKQVHDQPIKAMLIVAAAGFLAGMLFMRK